MTENKFYPLDLAQNTEKLKKLIEEHPDYPIVVLAGEDANSGDYYWMFCSDVSFNVGEILDCQAPYYDEAVCCDREYFEDKMSDWLFDKLLDDGIDAQHMPDEDFDKLLQEEIKKYEPYWKKVIVIWATN